MDPPSLDERLAAGPADRLAARALRYARRAPRAVQASVLCAIQAWRAARLDQGAPPTERIAVVVSTDGFGRRDDYDTLLKFLNGPEYLSPTYALQALATDHVGVLSEVLGIRGEGFTVGGASAGGNVALIKALQMIELGVTDVCLVVGASVDLSPLGLQSLHNIGAMGGTRLGANPAQSCRPFDSAAEGFVYGQGCGCVVLETELSRRRRAAPALACLAGGALTLAASSLAAPDREGEARAMRLCLEHAVTPCTHVDYVNAHGTSTPLGDATELRAIRDVFGERASRIWINSTKGLVGHCLFAAGVIEAIATVVQIRGRFVHGNPNLTAPIDEGLRLPRRTVEDVSIEAALSNSFGFGGINTSILLERAAV